MTAYYNEFDPGAAAWLRELIRRGLIADGVVDERSILDVEPDDLHGFTQCHWFSGIGGWSYALRLAGWPDDRPVWTGSPPCQPFSAAGKQRGKDDERHLAPHWTELVAVCRPPVIFGEQVASAAVFGKSAKRTGSSTDGALEWAWLDDLFDRLEAARYACGASDIPAAGVGAPHIRQRTFFGAVRLADADIAKQGMVGTGGEGVVGGGARNAPLGHRCCGGDVGLADAVRSGQPGPGEMGRPGNSEACQDWEVNRVDNAGRGSGLADADGWDARAERQQRGWEHGQQSQDGGPCGLADTSNSARQRSESRATIGGLSSRDESDAADRSANAPDSPWRDADWLFCRDGKWRPVESSVLGVVDGIPAELVRSGAYVPASSPLAPKAEGNPRRTMRLRGYGNAIIPYVAAEFVKAFENVRNQVL